MQRQLRAFDFGNFNKRCFEMKIIWNVMVKYWKNVKVIFVDAQKINWASN